MKGTCVDGLIGRWAVLIVFATIGVASPALIRGEGRLLKSQLKDGDGVHAAFRNAVARVNESLVAVLVGGRQVSLGTVVSDDGYILTKASELSRPLRCRLRDRREFDAAIVAVHDRYDVALLKIDASHLSAVEWADGRDPQVGQWLATPGLDELPLAVGIVSVARRPIPPEKGVLGVQLSEASPGPRVTYIVPNSAASRAGLQTGDLILRTADQAIKDPQTFDRLLRRFAPGDSVKVVVVRANHEMTLRAILGRSYASQVTRGYWMNRMSGRMSQRRAGFPQAIQHDTVLEPEMCGGPVVDLSGAAVGINIARGGRVETYAVPAEVVKTLVRELRSAPAGVAGPPTEAASIEPPSHPPELPLLPPSPAPPVVPVAPAAPATP